MDTEHASTHTLALQQDSAMKTFLTLIRRACFSFVGGCTLSLGQEVPSGSSVAPLLDMFENLGSVDPAPSQGSSTLSFHDSFQRTDASFISSETSSLGERSTRDYNIMSSVNKIAFGGGTGFFWRTYLVLDGKLDKMADTSYSLVDHVDYGTVVFSESSSKLL